MVGEQLAERHFSAQAEAAQALRAVGVAQLDPFLRGLLFTDGTVSRALEAHTLQAVRVEQIEQRAATAPAAPARFLEVSESEECLRRRVVMRVARAKPSIWAESFVVPQRLPSRFLEALQDNAQGIGGSLQELKLESWRELLWFGLAPPPSWPTPDGSETTLTRVYRIIVESRPALLISEAFAIELDQGLYHLAGI